MEICDFCKLDSTMSKYSLRNKHFWSGAAGMLWFLMFLFMFSAFSLHDSVVHCKKRVKVQGKWVWKKPNYTKVVIHKLADGRKLKVKAGTQVIVLAWRCLRSNLEGFSKAPGSNRFASAVRSAQWLYWNRGNDLWLATGAILKDLNYKWEVAFWLSVLSWPT